ncbi:MAG: hypothetical protein KAG61_09415 [Bacteriovoracaceae bacterium]|nr:hypothetical protein [Bacteriovoracaceae bacterium]
MKVKKRSTFKLEDSISNRKCCPKCEEFKEWSGFGKNKSKSDGHESWCKTCVSIKKAEAYAKKKKELKKKTKDAPIYSSSIEGELSEDAILEFSEIFEEIYRGLHYEGKI